MTRESAREPGGQLVQRGARLVDVVEAERGEPFLGRGLGQRADAGERVEQRREEQLLVDRAHDGLVAAMRRRRTRRGPSSPGESRKPRTRARCVRASVSSGIVCVWCSSTSWSRCSTRAQPHVRVGELRRVVAAHVAAARELLERVEGRARRARRGSARPCTSCSSCTANSMSRMPPYPRLTSRSATPLRRSMSSVRAFIARTSRTASGSRTSGHTKRSRAREERGAELGVARDRPRLDQRLELPRARPLLPVRLVRVDGAARARRRGLRAAARRRCGRRCRRRSARS